MTTIHPPRFGAHLLKLLVPAQDHDALLGDLCEEYHRGRSQAWYFAQILAAIVVGSWKDTRAHWVLAIRALAVGVASTALASRAVPFLAYVQVVLIYGLSNRPHRWLGILGPQTFVYSELMSVVGFVASGWLIVRLHRAHDIALAMPFAAVIAALTLMGFLRQALLLPAWTPGGAFVLLLSGANSVSFPLRILFGGYSATRSTERA
jgi:hypothetical protein